MSDSSSRRLRYRPGLRSFGHPFENVSPACDEARRRFPYSSGHLPYRGVWKHCLVFIAASWFGVVAGARVDPELMPIRTIGRRIVDVKGDRLKLQCVNWYGAHMKHMVVNGLDRAPLRETAAQLVDLGFNCVRLPYSLDLVMGAAGKTLVPFPAMTLAANPELQPLTAMEVFDVTVATLTGAGLIVILNNHVSSAMWCCSTWDGEGMWYTREWSEAQWFDHLVSITKRYRDNPLVAGFDLRNEIRSSHLGDPVWGGGDQKVDWAMAAEKGARLVLQENPDMLVIVTGITFGLFLCDVPKKPLHLEDGLIGKIAYTAHEYTWVNFHIVARMAIGVYMSFVVIWCLLLILLVACSWILECRGISLERRCSLWSERMGRCCGFSCGQRSTALLSSPALRRKRLVRSVVWASLLVIASIISFFVSPSFLNQCSMVSWVWGLAVSIAGFFLFGASLVLWMRAALFYFVGLLADGAVEVRGEALANSISSEDREGSGNPPHQDVEATGDTNPTVAAVSAATSSAARARATDAVTQPACAGVLGASPSARSSMLSFGSSGMELSASPQRTCHIEEDSSVQRPSWDSKVLFCWAATLSKRTFALGLTVACFVLLFLIHQHFGKYEVFASELDTRWGFLLSDDDKGAPVWVGEFGSDTRDLHWDHMMRYFRERDLDWSLWALNGEVRPGQNESFGLFKADMATIHYPWLLRDLQSLMTPASMSREELDHRFMVEEA